MAALKIARALHGRALHGFGTWIKCCKNSTEATAGDSQPQLSGGLGMLERSTIAFASGAAFFVTKSLQPHKLSQKDLA